MTDVRKMFYCHPKNLIIITEIDKLTQSHTRQEQIEKDLGPRFGSKRGSEISSQQPS